MRKNTGQKGATFFLWKNFPNTNATASSNVAVKKRLHGAEEERFPIPKQSLMLLGRGEGKEEKKKGRKKKEGGQHW